MKSLIFVLGRGEKEESFSVFGGGIGHRGREALMVVSEEAAMVIKSYQDQAEQLLKEYALADPFMPYVSIVGGTFACKMVCFLPIYFL